MAAFAEFALELGMNVDDGDSMARWDAPKLPVVTNCSWLGRQFHFADCADSW